MNKLKITIYLETEDEIIGVKEDFAYYCEKYGDINRIEVEEDGEK